MLKETIIHTTTKNDSILCNEYINKNKKALDFKDFFFSQELFARLYEDNVCGKISDERFEQMSKENETEQAVLIILLTQLFLNLLRKL